MFISVTEHLLRFDSTQHSANRLFPTKMTIISNDTDLRVKK